MSRKELTKAQSMRWHTKWALKERYGIFCNRKLYWHIVDKIKHGDSECLLEQSNSRHLHKVYVDVSLLTDKRTHIRVDILDKRVKLYVVYDKTRGELCTALPWYATDAEMLQDYFENHEYVRE